MTQYKCPAFVGRSVEHAIDVLPLDGDAHKRIQKGDVVYWQKDSTKIYYHMGVYVGSYYDQRNKIWYDDAVIEASPNRGVIARSLSDIESDPQNDGTSFYYGKLGRVDYAR